MSTIPIVGRNYVNTDVHGPLTEQAASQEVPTSPTRKSLGEGDSCWRKPHSSQVRDQTGPVLQDVSDHTGLICPGKASDWFNPSVKGTRLVQSSQMRDQNSTFLPGKGSD